MRTEAEERTSTESVADTHTHQSTQTWEVSLSGHRSAADRSAGVADAHLTLTGPVQTIFLLGNLWIVQL